MDGTKQKNIDTIVPTDVYSKDNLYAKLILDFGGYDSKRLRLAFEWAFDLHQGQKRKSGEPYIVHPLEVARQLMDLGLDEDTIIAALLHDVMEDCGIEYEEVKGKFGKIVADLVLAETKVDDLTSHSHIKFEDYTNLRRMLFAMTDDIRVLLIRLSDRLHNMKTVEHLKPERKITYSQETLNVYVPLAEYINIGKWKRELEDMAFKQVDPDLYAELERLRGLDKRTNPECIAQIEKELTDLMLEYKVPSTVSGRIKSAYSLHNKIRNYLSRGKVTEYSTERVRDLLAFRIVTENKNIIDCYKALGVIHNKYRHIPDDFDDYIAKPKDNGYQSLQTNIYINDMIVEIQIRTQEMHEYNEFGAASHISYKMHGSSKVSNAFSWVKNLVRWQKKGAQNFSIKDVLSDKVFVFTPKGQVIEMSKGATVIDFAYRIHTKVGNSTTGAKIDGKMVPLNSKINTGEVIEVITSKNKTVPHEEWLNFVLPKTANVIRREIQNHDRQKQITSGQEILKNKQKEFGFTLTPKDIMLLANEYAGGNVEEFYRKIHQKMINVTHLMNQTKKKLHPQKFDTKSVVVKEKFEPTKKEVVLAVDGHTGMQYYMAKCCNPNEKDDVVGFVSLEHGVTVHKSTCLSVKYLDPNRFVEVGWKRV